MDKHQGWYMLCAAHGTLVARRGELRCTKSDYEINVMHAGWPLADHLIAVLYNHPQVYCDVGIICYSLPREAFHDYLKRIVQAGFHRRIMFGSDQMNWPDAIEEGIKAIETAEFLTEAQKRDILYHNAARFLRLSQEEIDRHHGR